MKTIYPKIKWACPECDNQRILDFDPKLDYKKWSELKCNKCDYVNDVPRMELKGTKNSTKFTREKEICDNCANSGKVKNGCANCEKLMINNLRKEFGMKPLEKEKEYKDYLEKSGYRSDYKYSKTKFVSFEEEYQRELED